MNEQQHTVTVVGAGLAGCEAAWQLAERGIHVLLLDMKPGKKSPAHVSEKFAELVCSNSFRGDRLSNAVGLLKEEMRRLGSLIMRAADQTRVPAGGALAVDREAFAEAVTSSILRHPNIEVKEQEVTEIPSPPVIVATGPLTSDSLAESIRSLPGLRALHFYDAAAPIVHFESLHTEKMYRFSRYGRGEDYWNCPMDRSTYDRFIDALLGAETAEIHGFEENMVFDGCMPIESMARRGRMAPAFGPMKPVGLPDPRTGREPFAVVQLRQDNENGTLFNLVGFQTRLRFGEQKRVFGLIPGLEDAVYARYGTMHRNTFLNSPGFLQANYEMVSCPRCYFAGQMTGVEGYVESAGSGLVAGISMATDLLYGHRFFLPSLTALGAMGHYVSSPNPNFQPMNCSFGLIDSLPPANGARRIRNKQERYEAISDRSLKYLETMEQG